MRREIVLQFAYVGPSRRAVGACPQDEERMERTEHEMSLLEVKDLKRRRGA